MRREGGLWERLVSWPNLRAAARLAAAGRRTRASTLVFWDRLEEGLADLRSDLLARTYRPGPYREFWVREPKPRWISAAPFRDRVVHHALCRVIEPIFDRSMVAHTYACRAGKGTHRAILRAQEHLRAARWVWKADVAKFFPSVDHAILRRMLARRVKDAAVLGLCGTILDASPAPPAAPLAYLPGDDLFTPVERRRGIPIGNLTSQLWANVYLGGLDHFVQERLGIGRYVRYMDDLLLFDDDPDRLRAAAREVARHLAGLRLRLNPAKTHLVPSRRGIAFLGFHVYRTHRTLLVEGKVRARRRLRRLAAGYAGGEIGPAEARASVRAWIAHAAWGDTWRLRGRMLRETVFRRGVAMA